MKPKEFKEYMIQKGYKITGLTACGVENQYPVTVTYQTVKLWNVLFTVGPENWEIYKSDLKQALKGYASVSYVSDKLMVSVKMISPDSFQHAVSTTIDILRRNNVAAKKTCAFCNQGNCDSLVFHDGMYHPVHNTCCNQLMETAKSKVESNNTSGNYFLGLIGALLGMLIGIIPSILTIYFTEKIYAILFALIPMCIYYGYKLLKGKLNSIALGITIVLSLVSVYLIEIILMVIVLMTKSGAAFADALKLVKLLLGESETWVTITKEAASSFVFTALGIWISWSYISKTNEDVVMSIEEKLSTKMDYNDQTY